MQGSSARALPPSMLIGTRSIAPVRRAFSDNCRQRTYAALLQRDSGRAPFGFPQRMISCQARIICAIKPPANASVRAQGSAAVYANQWTMRAQK